MGVKCSGMIIDDREWDYENPANNFCRCPACKGFLPSDFPIDKIFTCKKCGAELMVFDVYDENGEKIPWEGKICPIKIEEQGNENRTC